MHVHFRQHFTKHFCSCGYQSASYDSIYCRQKSGACSTRGIHEVDMNSYPWFLRHIGWKKAPSFEECIPTLNGEGKQTMTFRQPTESLPRRPVKERLGKPVHTSRVYVPETHPEVERLEAEARWHEREAEAIIVPHRPLIGRSSEEKRYTFIWTLLCCYGDTIWLLETMLWIL